jgi:hypothetical protein
MAKKKTTKKKSTKKKLTKKQLQPLIPMPGVDYELNLPKGHLSHSQVELYLQCAMKFWYRYVLGVKEPYNVNLAEGQIMSKVAEATNRHYMEHEKHLSLKEVLKTLGVVANKELKKVKKWMKETPDSVLGRQEDFLRRLWTTDSGPDWEPTGAEVEFNVEIAGVPVNGFIDMTEVSEVTDFKVAKNTRFYQPTKSLQLDLYCHVAQIPYGSFLVFEKESGKITPKGELRNLKKVKRWLEIVYSNVAMGISNGQFHPCNPKENFLCSEQWCHNWKNCYGG